jgi:triphosphoribosyl-dephospho-CoA synthase
MSARPQTVAPTRLDATIARLAVRALYAELRAYPKPGLVSHVDSGSHADMNAATFMRSLFALRHYFAAMARAGAVHAPFARLQRLGIDGEIRMSAVTRGINTHRGAIFTLGLLAAAAGHVGSGSGVLAPEDLGRAVQTHWGRAIADMIPGRSHGAFAAQRYGAGGARAQAANGFPHVFAIGLPAWRRALAISGDPNRAAVYCFFSLMAAVDDTNLLHRGGLEGLRYAQAEARAFLAHADAPGWHAHAEAIHHAFVARHLSPGGSADLLAATLFVAELEGSSER